MRLRMAEIIRRYGLDSLPLDDVLGRSIGRARREVRGADFVAVNADCVEETASMAEASTDLIVTSIPFSNHYEYSASYNDFGHTDNNDHFWRQMDFLTPQLLRVLKPGRLACIHVKDRILFGSVTGTGVPTVSPFHAEGIFHYRRHGFDYMGMITVVTDVVRENNATYRLGWTENSKDATKMGVGSPEYILLFRKPQSDRSRGYADAPVEKPKEAYTRARWQIDAHSFWRSSGERLLTGAELSSLSQAALMSLWEKRSLGSVYDYEAHVALGQQLEDRGALSKTFMTLAPPSAAEDVWHDVTRMQTLNSLQTSGGREKHVCPIQFDIVDRLIERYSNPGETVLDPFAGLMTVPYRAILKRRRGYGIELHDVYWLDGVRYCRAAEEKRAIPSLFDALASEDAA
jgi:DNA modification methylase